MPSEIWISSGYYSCVVIDIYMYIYIYTFSTVPIRDQYFYQWVIRNHVGASLVQRNKDYIKLEHSLSCIIVQFKITTFL